MRVTFAKSRRNVVNSYTQKCVFFITRHSHCRFADIRDTVNYKEVMKQYRLGPNGGIVTTLNLFSTKFGQVVDLVRKAGEKHKYCVIDTPGQIEVFTWSASGTIITEALATSFPTIIVYVMDVPRSKCPTTFMSNMLYACSILYKSRLPFIVVMNKVEFVAGFVAANVFS